MAERKTKLTLTVDAETVKKAKELGFNISDVTEKVLRGFAFDPRDEGREALLSHYKAMFDAMQPLLRKYDATVAVAKLPLEDDPFSEEDLTLLSDGRFWVDPEEAIITYDRVRELYLSKPVGLYFLEPTRIFRGLIDSLERAKRARREELESLELTRRIIEALWEPESKGSAKERRQGKRPGGRPNLLAKQ